MRTRAMRKRAAVFPRPEQIRLNSSYVPKCIAGFIRAANPDVRRRDAQNLPLQMVVRVNYSYLRSSRSHAESITFEGDSSLGESMLLNSPLVSSNQSADISARKTFDPDL